MGGRDCANVKKVPNHGDVFGVGQIYMSALHTPCHTQDSICYFFQDGEDRVVFTGDTLFTGGCGRFFEGTANQMHTALNSVLAGLPNDTKVYPGHEYTKGNVKFAKSLLKDDSAINNLEAYSQANKETQGKFTIKDEKASLVMLTQSVERPLTQSAPQRLHARRRSPTPKDHRQDGSCRGHGRVARNVWLSNPSWTGTLTDLP
jgi:hydroxyacylglutathione hydrolase